MSAEAYNAPRRRRLELIAVAGIPRIQAGMPLTEILLRALQEETVQDGDIVAVTSKLYSRAQGRFVLLDDVEITPDAEKIAVAVDKDPALVSLILSESTAISRQRPGVLIVRNKLGIVCANAGIDRSNALPADAPEHTRGQWALLLPANPDADAQGLREAVRERFGVNIGVVITDSHGRPFRHGTVGLAIGAAGLPALDPHEGRHDLDGRPLEVTLTAVADQVAAAADLVAGQADEGTPVVIVRGFRAHGEGTARELIRDADKDLYA